jgi:hypothetical protein
MQRIKRQNTETEINILFKLMIKSFYEINLKVCYIALYNEKSYIDRSTQSHQLVN